MPKPLDPFWEYGEPDPPGNRQHLSCKLCGKKMFGGINRLKYHLAKIPGNEIEICPKSSEELVARATKALEEFSANKDYTKAKKKEMASRSTPRGSTPTHGAMGVESSEIHSSQSVNPTATSSYFIPRTTPGAQPSIISMMKKKEKEEADKLVGRCLLWSDIPFSFANNPFYVSMFEAASIVGPGYKPPTYHELRGPILQNEKTDCTQRLQELRDSWQFTGCTVMSDGWTDGKGRTLLNFLVHCPRGTMFLKSVDASAHVKDATLLCDLLDGFIQEVGPQHVVQVITDNAANYVAAGRMLMSRYPTLFWTPCAAHCLDLMLEDMGKLDWIKETIDSARSITKFIYNHASVLSMMRQFTGDKELVRPAITRFATSFISLRSLLNSRWELQTMFLSPEWRALSFSSKPEGQAIMRLVAYQDSFWDAVNEVCTISEPLVKVLRLVDGDKPTMGYLYEAMDRAKESIRAYYVDKGDQGHERKEMIWMVIDDRWNHTLHRPIHAAGLYLNPAFSYSYGFRFDSEVMSGFFECVQRMVPSAADRLELSQQLELYKRSIGLFGFDMAINDRKNIMPSKFHLVLSFNF
jgi:hypothetical protein